MESTTQIFKSLNKATEQKIISDISKLPKLEIKPTTMHDWAFEEPIHELNKKKRDF